MRRISSSRPMTGSSLPARAAAVMSWVGARVGGGARKGGGKDTARDGAVRQGEQLPWPRAPRDAVPGQHQAATKASVRCVVGAVCCSTRGHLGHGIPPNLHIRPQTRLHTRPHTAQGRPRWLPRPAPRPQHHAPSIPRMLCPPATCPTVHPRRYPAPCPPPPCPHLREALQGRLVGVSPAHGPRRLQQRLHRVLQLLLGQRVGGVWRPNTTSTTRPN